MGCTQEGLPLKLTKSLRWVHIISQGLFCWLWQEWQAWMVSLHAVIFMLRKVESTSDVNRGPEPCQRGTALTFPSYLPCLSTWVISQIDGAVRAYEHVHDDHVKNLTLSSLKWSRTPQTHARTSIYKKLLPVPRVFGARSGSPRIIYWQYWCIIVSSLTIQVALSKAGSHCHVLEERNAVLWRVRSATMGKDSESCQIMTLVNSKASQWQVI